jgi:hypothetical protein
MNPWPIQVDVMPNIVRVVAGMTRGRPDAVAYVVPKVVPGSRHKRIPVAKSQ